MVEGILSQLKAAAKSLLVRLIPVLAIIGLIAAVGWFVTNRFGSDDNRPRLTYVESIGTPGPGVTDLLTLPDDGKAPFLAEINAARESVLVEVYLLSDNEIIEALIRAHNRGAAVRVLLEEHPFGGAGNEEEVFKRLSAAGIEVRWNNPVFRFAHIKSMVVDGSVLFVMNLNLTKAAFSGNRDFAVITTEAAPVAQAIAVFESDWERGTEPPDGPLVISPTTSRQDLLDLIASADESIDVYAEVITDREIMRALTDAARNGIRVRLLMSESSEDDHWSDEPGELARAGVDVRVLNRLYVHAKMILVDNARVYIGSQNYTSTSLDQNREMGMILTDPGIVVKVARTFDGDFREAVELREAS